MLGLKFLHHLVVPATTVSIGRYLGKLVASSWRGQVAYQCDHKTVDRKVLIPQLTMFVLNRQESVGYSREGTLCWVFMFFIVKRAVFLLMVLYPLCIKLH
jgi:hypothetical protein